MRGKVIVVTGATSGIGQAAAEELAATGARIVLIARDRGRAAASLDGLRASHPGIGNPGGEHTVHFADLSRLSEMKRVASEIAAAEPNIDVLINNAGGAFTRRRETEDGLEMTFALNHLAYFVVTLGLLDRLRASPPARIVNTSSMTYAGASLDFDDLQSAKGYSGATAYARSKLANVLFTRELARRLAGTGVTANCYHPGFVATRLGHQDGGISKIWGISTSGALSPEEGAKTLLYLATSPEVAATSGEYFNRSRVERLSRNALDDAAARRLWEESARIAGISAQAAC
ncbi:MAG TPA: SDR family oxidoreductase [Bryobacteraceae bacterium]|nr:SDR family oxidoreductase [Bryobacteraceae bacterium]